MPKLAEYRGARAPRSPLDAKLVEVTFSLDKPGAHEVYLCGDFNEWSPTSLKMLLRNNNGVWEKRITLAPGRYQYKFLVDGEWVHNPQARENIPNELGSLNSVMEVQG